jgi:transcriptional regulator with XRE-family HTH domain
MSCRDHTIKRSRAKDELRLQARALRTQGLTYGEIAERTGASKGSLSLWLHDVQLSGPARDILAARRAAVRTNAGRMLRDRRMERERRIRTHAAAEIGSISERELVIAGVIAYWCEGAKAKPWSPSQHMQFINSDPNLIKLYLAFLKTLGVSKEDLVFRVQIPRIGKRRRGTGVLVCADRRAAGELPTSRAEEAQSEYQAS